MITCINNIKTFFFCFFLIYIIYCCYRLYILKKILCFYRNEIKRHDAEALESVMTQVNERGRRNNIEFPHERPTDIRLETLR